MPLQRAILTQWPFVTVLVLAAVGFGYAACAPQHWLRGIVVVAIGLIAAGLLRALLPQRRAGMLVVRGRVFDVLCYLALGAALIGFGASLPR